MPKATPFMHRRDGSMPLRMELAPFNVKVITIQPGAIQSEFGNTASKLAVSPLQPGSMYGAMSNAILARAKISQKKTMPAAMFARILVGKVVANDPEPIIRIGPHSRVLPFLKRWIPTRALDRMLSKKFGVITDAR